MGMMDKFWLWLGVEHQEEVDEEEIIETPVNKPEIVKKSNLNNNTGSGSAANIVSIHTNKSMKVIVCDPESFDEVQVLCNYLKNRKQVITNLENTPPEISQRIVDFLSGATYSLEGQSQQIGRNIFLFTPSNVEVAKDHRTLMRKHGMNNPSGGEK